MYQTPGKGTSLGRRSFCLGSVDNQQDNKYAGSSFGQIKRAGVAFRQPFLFEEVTSLRMNFSDAFDDTI
jgi:hypothetical protein